MVEQENFVLVDGLHEAIIPEDVWQAAQVKLAAQAKRYENVNKRKNECTHLLSGIVKCPVCGVGMYGNKCVKRKADGSKYKDFYYYGCKHRSMTRGHKCDYKKQIRKELLDDAVAEVICKLVSNPKFAAMMQEKINMKVDTTAIEQEISNYEKQLRQAYSTKSKLIEEIDSLDPDDRHYSRRKSDLDDRLYGMYDKIEELESLLIAARAKKQAIEAEKLTGDNIYKVLIYFDQLYGKMNDREKRQLIEELISEIQIYPERQPNGQWLKSIKFRLPIIEEDMNISLDNEQQVESVVRLERDGSCKTEQGSRASLGAEGEIDFADIALLNAELKQRGLRYHIYYKDEHTACLEPPGACCLTEDLKQNTMQCIREYYEKKHRLVHFFGGDLYFTCGELPAD